VNQKTSIPSINVPPDQLPPEAFRPKRFKFNLSLISVLILVGGYLIAVFNFINVSQTTASDTDRGIRVVRLAHWQLEPGYREALDWAIEQYHQLPHVKESNVMIQQMGVTERVYNQFMNVHLIAGTAPDIAASGMTRLIQGNNIAKFYTPLSDYINDPNPYNDPRYLADHLDAELVEFLSTAPWRNTFVDGMQGGFNDELNDYFAIPVSSWGGQRLFYNMRLVAEAKAFVREGLASNPMPRWLKGSLFDFAGPDDFPLLTDSAQLRDWLNGETPPETLGQMMLLMEAIVQLRQEKNMPFLVGLSASSYAPNILSSRYRDVFFLPAGLQTNFLYGSGVTGFDAAIGLSLGKWNFDMTEVRAFYEFAQRLVRFYPKGWLGLDREQAQRRFVLGSALAIVTGGWDASSIIRSVADRTDAFPVVITRPPLPGPGDRYEEYIPLLGSEAASRLGVPLSINRQSRNFDWALDFLKFITSKPINEELNSRAGWVPGIVGSQITEHMRPFAPNVEGIPSGLAIGFDRFTGPLRSEIAGAEPLLINGEISYDAFVDRIMRVLDNPRLGITNIWFREYQNNRDRSRDRSRGISIERSKAFFYNDQAAANRLPTLLYSNSRIDEGTNIRLLHHQLLPEEPFPTRN
jgi:raffinose/stachyose/melibiose transport system substrate-binding protein